MKTGKLRKKMPWSEFLRARSCWACQFKVLKAEEAVPDVYDYLQWNEMSVYSYNILSEEHGLHSGLCSDQIFAQKIHESTAHHQLLVRWAETYCPHFPIVHFHSLSFVTVIHQASYLWHLLLLSASQVAAREIIGIFDTVCWVLCSRSCWDEVAN